MSADVPLIASVIRNVHDSRGTGSQGLTKAGCTSERNFLPLSHPELLLKPKYIEFLGRSSPTE
jgi:hypothetical protein